MSDDPQIDPVAAIMAAAVDVPVPEGFGAGFTPDPRDAARDDGRVQDGPGDEYPYGADDPGHDPGATQGFDGGNGGPPIEDDPELSARLARAVDFALNDVGNGQRMVLHFGEDILWVPRVGWHGWTGTHWQVDPDEIAVGLLAQKLGPLIAQEIPFVQTYPGMWARLGQEPDVIAARAAGLRQTDDAGKITPEGQAAVDAADADLKDIRSLKEALGKLRGRHASFAQSSGNTQKMESALKVAGLLKATVLDEMDAAPLQVNCLSGVLDFSVGQDAVGKKAVVQLVPHARDQRHTKIMPVLYDPEAQAPLFIKFLTRIQPDVQIRQFLQRVFGLAMTGLTGDQMLCFFYGMGANGKSVLMDLIARILGSYAATARIESLTGVNRGSGKDATPDLIPLIAARMVRAAEPEEGVKWQEGLIKDLTGGEPIMMRANYGDAFYVRPQFKLIISGNSKPDIRGTDDGIWRRLKLVPFDVQIPEEERIPKTELDQLLFAEAPGVLNWMVEGLLDYLEQGLREPDAVRSATQEFREESDPFGMFVNACCEVTGDPAHVILSRDLVNAFLFWQEVNGKGAFSDKTVEKRLSKMSERWVCGKTGQRFTKGRASIVSYSGIRVAREFGREWDDAPKDARGRMVTTRSRTSDAGDRDGAF